MSRYLLNTNICIYYLKGHFDLNKKFDSVGFKDIAISEITLAELKYGAEKSEHQEKNRLVVDEFSNRLTVIPIFSSLDVYAKEKARLRKLGKPVDDFDLLIGSTAISNNMIMVTRNVTHFSRLNQIQIENWVEN